MTANAPGQPPRVRKVLWSAAFIVLVLGMVAFFVMHARVSRSLLAKATPIDLPIQLGRDTTSCTWLDEDRIMVQRQSAQRIDPPYLVNLRTGQTNSLPGLLKALESDLGTATLDMFRVSPDRKWLLISCYLGTNHQMIAATLDGTERRVWHEPFAGHGFAWLRDSRHWVQFLFRTQPVVARVYSLDTPDTREFTTSFEDYVFVKGRTPDGCLLLQRDKPGSWEGRYGEVAFAKVNDTNFALCGTPWRVRFPFDVDVNWNSWAFSCDGSRLAGETIQTRQWKLLLRRLPWWRLLSPDYTRGTGLWVSQADGSKLRVLGEAAAGEYAFSPRWMSDGRHVSFLFSDTNKNVTFWKIPVN